MIFDKTETNKDADFDKTERNYSCCFYNRLTFNKLYDILRKSP